MSPMALSNSLSFSGSAALILLGAFVLGILLVTGTELRRPRADLLVRGVAGGLMAALIAGVFASASNDTGTPTSAPSAAASGGNGAPAGGGLGAPAPGQPGATPGANGAPGTSSGGVPGSSAQGGVGGSSTSGPGAASSSGAGTAAGGPAATGPSAAAAAQLPPLRVGFIGLNPNDSEVQGEAGAGVVPPPPDPNKTAQAVQDYVNNHGGINGRKVTVDVKERSPSSNNASEELGLCSQMTEGDHVFMVFGSTGGNNGDAEACYARAHTPFLCDCPELQTDLKKDAPYIWTPGNVYEEAKYGALVQALGEQGFFANGTKLGVPIDDTPDYHNLFTNTLLPIIQHYHNYSSSDIETYNIKDAQSAADFGQLGSDMQQAAITFNKDSVNRVFFLYDGDLPAQDFMTAAESQQYHPIYGVHSTNHPYLTLQKEVPADQLHGALGDGLAEAADVDNAHADPFPTGQGETECLAALKSGGIVPSGRAQMSYSAPLCDGLFMLRDAAEGLGASFTAEQWAAAAQNLGTRFQSAQSLPDTTRYIPNRYSGADGYRWLHYVDNCSGDPDADPNGGGCFQYYGSVRFMPF